jgi:hypothetical protein
MRLEDMALFFGYKLHARDVSAQILLVRFFYTRPQDAFAYQS